MKALIIFFVALIPLQWGTDLDMAKKAAKEKNQMILLYFSGSDWCAPCIATRKEYFESESFAQMAKDNLVLVNADFPRRKKNQLSAEQVSKNNAMAEKYNKEGNFPYTLLLDADGKIIKGWKGKPEVPVEKWVNEVKAVCKSHRK
ncbi:thiol-disulfide isomerase [Flavobacterium cyanobacteriorum]|uniref:Thiol-disulfide isomerase n=1 Tax=Flavobacterium cyanobacteriorum TaxID=2022802 RepID=A0A255Z9B7_9FLAO|nr:thioredoxin family protein [Flavobacterium cyanobacteriorum]OYQ38058.1 thiol-disulfide isomerase [Flavobacterium cyanobacteriorum]